MIYIIIIYFCIHISEKKIPYRIILKNELKNKNEIKISCLILDLLIIEEIDDVYNLCDTEIKDEIIEKEKLIEKIKKDKKNEDERDNFLPEIIVASSNKIKQWKGSVGDLLHIFIIIIIFLMRVHEFFMCFI